MIQILHITLILALAILFAYLFLEILYRGLVKGEDVNVEEEKTEEPEAQRAYERGSSPYCPARQSDVYKERLPQAGSSKSTTTSRRGYGQMITPARPATRIVHVVEEPHYYEDDYRRSFATNIVEQAATALIIDELTHHTHEPVYSQPAPPEPDRNGSFDGGGASDTYEETVRSSYSYEDNSSSSYSSSDSSSYDSCDSGSCGGSDD